MPAPIIYDEKFFIDKCLLLIEERSQMGPHDQWTNSNYVDLAFEVGRISKISLSAITLKRIFGKVQMDDEYDPQQATKDALAVYLGFLNWRDFKLSQIRKENIEVKDDGLFSPGKTGTTESQKQKTFFTKKNFLFASVIVLIGIIALLFNFFRKDKVTLCGQYLKGKAYHTAVFSYRVPDHGRFILDLGNGESKELNPKDSVVSAFYQLPGVYHVKLMKRNNVLKDTSVVISTDGWEAFANVNQENIRYAPLKLTDSNLRASSAQFVSAGIDTSKIFWAHYCNVKDYGIPGDSFMLDCEVINARTIADVRCNHIRIDVLGTKNFITLYFTKEGCATWNKLQFGDKTIDGNKADLTVFSRDFSDWRKIKLEVKNKTVEVFFEEKKIYRCSYNDSIGNIAGLRFSFTGYGEAKCIKLQNIE